MTTKVSNSSSTSTSALGYLLSGGIAAAANYGSRFMFSMALPFEAAVVAAYGVGMITGFLLMRRYAFSGGRNSTRSQVIGYSLVNLLAVLQTVAISSLLSRLVLPWLGAPGNHQAMAHAVGVAFPVVSSYFGHKLLTFR
jgi:putative flippase GtrA